MGNCGGVSNPNYLTQLSPTKPFDDNNVWSRIKKTQHDDFCGKIFEQQRTFRNKIETDFGKDWDLIGDPIPPTAKNRVTGEIISWINTPDICKN